MADYGAYNMEHMSRAYEDKDLELMWLHCQVMSDYLRDTADGLDRQEGTLFAWFKRLSKDLRDCADAAYDARELHRPADERMFRRN